jgi:hypothetical protein
MITLIPAAPDPWAMWGAIGTLAGDVIASLALLAALVAAWATYQQLQTLRTENRRRQAAGVTAWSDGTRGPLVLNSSASPVYSAVVLTETAGTVYRFPVLSPMTQPIRAEQALVIELGEQPVAVAVLGRDVGDDPGPGAGIGGLDGQPFEQIGGHVDLDDAALGSATTGAGGRARMVPASRR